MSDPYRLLSLRNAGYIDPQTQNTIRNTRLLIAGCGIGSSFAETAVRLGFEHIILLDGDTVDAHNLNRQCYIHADIGKYKTQALTERLQAINPNAQITQYNCFLNADNAQGFVKEADIVFDTIDFLDLSGIVALHDASEHLKKPVITALSIGWGAGCIYFPADSQHNFRSLFNLPTTGSVENHSYIEKFSGVLKHLAPHLDTRVMQVVGTALTVMQDGKPCPAPQVAPGAASVGALAGTLIVKILGGEAVEAAPMMQLIDMNTACRQTRISLI